MGVFYLLLCFAGGEEAPKDKDRDKTNHAAAAYNRTANGCTKDCGSSTGEDRNSTDNQTKILTPLGLVKASRYNCIFNRMAVLLLSLRHQDNALCKTRGDSVVFSEQVGGWQRALKRRVLRNYPLLPRYGFG